MIVYMKKVLHPRYKMDEIVDREMWAVKWKHHEHHVGCGSAPKPNELNYKTLLIFLPVRVADGQSCFRHKIKHVYKTFPEKEEEAFLTANIH